jgi:hypothetical protein
MITTRMPLYISTLLIGLVLGVYAMLYGMRRRAVVPGAPSLPPWAAVLNWTVPAAALFGFGSVGALAHRADTPPIPAPAIAGLGATIAALVQVALSRWALTAPPLEDDAPAHRLAGLPVTVLATIPVGGLGRICYTLDATTHDVAARGVGELSIRPGDDVVIERIDDDGIIVVERWDSVEPRL